MKRLTEIVDLEKSQLENIKRVQNFLVAHPGYIKRGCGNIANKLGCTYDEVKQAKRSLKIDSVSLKEEVVEEVDEVYLPNILILDVETAPLRGFIWQLWKQNVNIDQIISERFMLTWSAK